MSTLAGAPAGLAWLAVFVGAGLGACARHAFNLGLNRWLPALPLGTLVSNLVGGFLVGAAIAFFSARTDLSPLWRLFAITGVLGGLTTFSTFSAEVVHALERGQPGWALATAALHLGGSLALTALGLWTVRSALA